MNADKTDSKSRDLRSTKDCCVCDVGLTGFAECQMAGPNPCPYALPFGYGFLCRHPQLDALIEKSRERQAAALPK
ncbi:MAG TPA: hypothetical protein VLZ89_00365 [Anaerolineales bacterium]|nr:hypothetical protein [Anaerolineales bacterium]